LSNSDVNIPNNNIPILHYSYQDRAPSSQDSQDSSWQEFSKLVWTLFSKIVKYWCEYSK